MRLHLAAFMSSLILAGPVAAGTSLDVQAINDAQWSSEKMPKKGLNAVAVRAQVLLDRARFSPGEIDGKLGDNFKKALVAFANEQQLQTGGELNEEVWQKLLATSAEPVLGEHRLSEDDVRGPFTKTIPAKLEAMRDLPSLGYTTPREKIAEKFHMSEELLASLNPGQKFETAGERIIVANVATGALPNKVARLEIDKSAQTLKAFSRERMLLAFYPITAGSTEKPAPSGRLTVTSVSKNPTYRYDPAYAFKGVKAREPFTIKDGPNNPVGLVWIGLSAKGYGIHGTPDPSKVSKSESHGCIRLTNWDALQIAAVVSKGTPVDFTGDERSGRKSKVEASTNGKAR